MIAVTGASGLIGSALVARLQADGRRVLALGGDVRSPAATERMLDDGGFEAMVHLAARSTVGEAAGAPSEAFDVNVRGTWEVMQACARNRVGRVVVASTPQVRVVPPLGTYAATKAAAEAVALAHGPGVAVLRFANVYGPGDRRMSRLVPGTISSALAGRAPVVHGGGSAQRDFLWVGDAVEAILTVLAGGDGVFEAGSGRQRPVGEVARLICTLADAGVQPDVRRGGGHGPEAVPVDDARLRAVGWTPKVSLEEGLMRTVVAARAATR